MNRNSIQMNRRNESTPEESSEKGISLITWILFIATVVAGSYYWLYWVPTPLHLNADPSRFSEERALTHVHTLSEEIGFRQASTPGLRKAAEYLTKECQKLADFIADNRPDLEAQVDVEMVSGSIIDRIFKHDIINVYRNLTNIILYIAPKAFNNQKAFMINAHFDSAIGSPGAADCASCVAIGLETVRALVQGGFTFPCPLLLLLNGGEETLLQAAHGFTTQSKWKDKVGSFMNLESTGSGGPPLLFQYSGSWTLSSYASGTSNPRGVVLAQEFFEAGIIPADTDFRIFAKHTGNYPGIDIATIMDATAYHTNRDTLSRLRKGTTQEFGDTVLGVTKSFMNRTSTQDQSNEKMVYMDLMHSFLLLFPLRKSYWVYRLPFGFIAISANLSNKPTEFLIAGGSGLLRNVFSCFLATVLPALFGALRAFLSDQPMVWFGYHSAAFVFFWPGALLGHLIPMSINLNRNQISGQFAGISLYMSSISLFMAYNEVGSSLIPLIIAISTSVISVTMHIDNRLPLSLFLLLGLVSCTCMASLLLALIKHIMEKVGMAGGGISQYQNIFPDLIIGGLNGFLFTLSLQGISPFLTAGWSQKAKRQAITSLTVFTILAGILTSFVFPYTLENPKRIFLTHTCRKQSDLSCESIWSVSTMDVIDVRHCLPDSLKKKTPIKSDPRDAVSISPLDKALSGMVFPGPSMVEPDPLGDKHPCLNLKSKSDHREKNLKRLNFELQWDRPGLGAMYIYGPIIDWSLSEKRAVKYNEKNLVRFAQDAHEPVWPFWIEIDEEGKLEIQLGIYYPTVNKETAELGKSFPPWVALVAGTSFVSNFTFQ